MTGTRWSRVKSYITRANTDSVFRTTAIDAR